jgi:hypothetical protein
LQHAVAQFGVDVLKDLPESDSRRWIGGERGSDLL